MSISLSDVEAREKPQQGIIKPGIEAEFRLAQFVRHLDMTVPMDERPDFVRRLIIDRLYGDIARDFEKFMEAIGSGAGEAAVSLGETIRAKLRGEGTGLGRHRAPV